MITLASFAFNQFTGPLLESIGNLTSLTQLDVGQNQLEGELPNMSKCRGLLPVYICNCNCWSANPPSLIAKLLLSLSSTRPIGEHEELASESKFVYRLD